MISDNEIRILDLLPHADEDGPIECDIRVADLSDEPDYESLSYVWGDESHLLKIHVGGQEVGVTANLHAGLKRIRLKDKPRSLWVDQLCINQWDVAEKTQQVQLMREIYSCSRRCLLWLGEVPDHIAYEDTEALWEVLEYMARYSETEGSADETVPKCLDSQETLQGPVKALVAMSKESSWWSRVWTVQEVALPKESSIHWGPLAMPWERLRSAADTWVVYGIDVLGHLTIQHVGIFGNLMAVMVWLGIAKDQHEAPLNLVTRWRYRKATDPRDKIYALLGLTSPGALPAVERCDYSLSTVELYCTLTIELILNEGSLLPLIKDPRLEADLATPNMPRWALDLAELPRYDTDWYHLYGYSHYNAHGGRLMNMKRLRECAEQTKETLLLTGTRVDTIEWVAEALYKPAGEDREDLQVFRDGIRSWQSFARKHVVVGSSESSSWYPGDYTQREAFGRTMLGDLIRDYQQRVDRRATKEDVDYLYDYIETTDYNYIQDTAKQMVANQRFFVTKSGLMGLGHLDNEPGDEVWVFYGGRVPFTIRKRDEGGEKDYDFNGRCYVQGIMDGEVFQQGGGSWEKCRLKSIILH